MNSTALKLDILSVCTAFFAVLATVAMPAQALVLDFEGASGSANTVGGFLDVGDFRFTLDAGSSGFIFLSGQGDIVESDTTKLFGANRTNVTMTRVDGGFFDLFSFDIGGSFASSPARWASSVDVAGSNGSFLSAIVGPNPTYNTVTPGWSSLTSVTWTPLINASGGVFNYEFTLDNINFAASEPVPAPPLPALVGIALLGLGWGRSRRQASKQAMCKFL